MADLGLFSFLEDISPFRSTTDTPVLDFWVISALGFKAKVTCVILRFTSCAAPVDCFEISMATESLQSTYLQMCQQALVDVRGSNPRPHAASTTLLEFNFYHYQYDTSFCFGVKGKRNHFLPIWKRSLAASDSSYVIIPWSLAVKFCQSRLSLLILHWLHEKILMWTFCWLAQRKWHN